MENRKEYTSSLNIYAINFCDASSFLKLTEQDFKIDSRCKQCNKFSKEREENWMYVWGREKIRIASCAPWRQYILLLMWMRAVWILKLSHEAYMIFRKRRALTSLERDNDNDDTFANIVIPFEYIVTLFVLCICSPSPGIDCAIQWRWFNGNMMWISKWHSMWDTWLWMCVTHYTVTTISICSVFAFQGSNQKLHMSMCVCLYIGSCLH